MDPLQNSVSEVLHAAGHQSPELGGGAASTIAGLIGLSLVRMALTTTGEKAKRDVTQPLSRLDAVSGALADLARVDVAVFHRYVDALQLPRGTDGEETRRDEALRDSGQKAAEIPLRAASLIAEGLEIAAEIVAETESAVASDVYAGAAILKGGFVGAIATLDINLTPKRMAAERDGLLGRRQLAVERQAVAMVKISRQAEADGFFMG